MSGLLRRFAGLGLLPIAAMIATPSAQASSGCWDDDAVTAARVMEFQIAMMVATLRCTALNFNLESDFKRFAEANKPALKEADLRLKKQFGDAGKGVNVGYQNYQTKVSNRHSIRDATVPTCSLFRDVAAELGKDQTSAATLTSFANALIPEPLLDGARCVRTVSAQ